MRTTLHIADDVMQAARVLAASRKESIGKVVSDLARRGLKPMAPVRYRGTFPVFDVPEDAPVFGPEQVREALEE